MGQRKKEPLSLAGNDMVPERAGAHSAVKPTKTFFSQPEHLHGVPPPKSQEMGPHPLTWWMQN